jgi:hypothetical protein
VEKLKKINNMYFKDENKFKTSKHQKDLKKFDPKTLKKYRLNRFFYHNRVPNHIMTMKFRDEKINLIKSIFVFIFLISFFCGIYFFLLFMTDTIYNDYGLSIFKIWLFPVLAQLVFVKFLINFSLNVVKAFFLFKYYPERKTKFLAKWFYMFMISKDLIHIYKVRNFVTKYYTNMKIFEKKNILQNEEKSLSKPDDVILVKTNE